MSVDILPDLKDGDSHYWTPMPERKSRRTLIHVLGYLSTTPEETKTRKN